MKKVYKVTKHFAFGLCTVSQIAPGLLASTKDILLHTYVTATDVSVLQMIVKTACEVNINFEKLKNSKALETKLGSSKKKYCRRDECIK